MKQTSHTLPQDYDIPQGVLDLYDEYAHGGMDRRTFLHRLGVFATAAVSVSALAACVTPDYSEATSEVKSSAPEITVETLSYFSDGMGKEAPREIKGNLVLPAGASTPLGGVIVIHENRGLNPYIKDVARRVAAAGYVALAPDALTPLGGYPGNDDDGRTLQRQRDRSEMLSDFFRAADVLRNHPACNGKVAAVGFCFGGGVANLMAARLPWLAGAVPFYGGWPTADDAALVNAPLLVHLGELDKRVNAGWPDYEAALIANDVDYEAHIYPGANHGFHNNTTPRYDAGSAQLAWSRTLAFFDRVLS
jgi:carboxymethylenebutenolidase